MRIITKPIILSFIIIIIALTATTADLLLDPSHGRKQSFIKPTYVTELSALDWHVASLNKRETFSANRLYESWLDSSMHEFYEAIDFDLTRFEKDDLLTFTTYNLVETCNLAGERHPFLLTVIEYDNEKIAWYTSNFAYIPGVFSLESRTTLMERLGCQRDV
jgi:hypothetical protein